MWNNVGEGKNNPNGTWREKESLKYHLQDPSVQMGLDEEEDSRSP